MNISEYFNIDVCNYASYDNYRKIGSIIDGLKPSSRKCIYTILKNNISTPKKVSQLKSDAASQTQYLHGDQSLEGVLVSLAQDFAGSNNIPLLKREGSFGTRLIPAAAAGRYIFTCKEDYLDKIFRKEDEPILIEQTFEGEKIEPKFYVPIIPLLIINGSIGLTTGFSQKILQRNPLEVIEYIEAKLNGKDVSKFSLTPWFKGFVGDVKQAEGKPVGNWIVTGKVDKLSLSELMITEIPVNYTLEDYIAILDDLEANKEIREYQDLSDNGSFKFKIKLFRTEQGISANDADLLSKLKLVTSISESFTSFDETNKVNEFTSIQQLIDHFFNVRLDFYRKRKEWLIKDMTKKIIETVSKYMFICGVVGKKIVISNKSDKEIEEQLEKIDKIIKINDSYDYLLNMPMKSLTKTNLDKLKEDIKSSKEKLDEIKAESVEKMWLKDLAELKKVIK
jgi:DNA topoisomerase-2